MTDETEELDDPVEQYQPGDYVMKEKTMADETKEINDPFEQYQAGDYVRHMKFGDGQILHRSGSGEDTKLVVSFTTEGEKRLLARLARLKKIRPVENASSDEES